MRHGALLLVLGLGACAGGEGEKESCEAVADGEGDPDDPSTLFQEECQVEICCETGEVLSCRHYVDDSFDEGAACEAECGGTIEAVRGRCTLTGP